METGLLYLPALWSGAERSSWISALISPSPNALAYTKSRASLAGRQSTQARDLEHSRYSTKDSFCDADVDSSLTQE